MLTTKATSASTGKTEPSSSDRFHAAGRDLFFYTEVVKLAACAAAMQHSLSMMESAAKLRPKEMDAIHELCPGVNDWLEMPTEATHWALTMAAQRIDDVVSTMSSAFMEAERAAETAKP